MGRFSWRSSTTRAVLVFSSVSGAVDKRFAGDSGAVVRFHVTLVAARAASGLLFLKHHEVLPKCGVAYSVCRCYVVLPIVRDRHHDLLVGEFVALGVR